MILGFEACYPAKRPRERLEPLETVGTLPLTFDGRENIQLNLPKNWKGMQTNITVQSLDGSKIARGEADLAALGMSPLSAIHTKSPQSSVSSGFGPDTYETCPKFVDVEVPEGGGLFLEDSSEYLPYGQLVHRFMARMPSDDSIGQSNFEIPRESLQQLRKLKKQEKRMQFEEKMKSGLFMEIIPENPDS